MAEVEVRVADKIAPSISANLLKIGTQAKAAETAIRALNKAMADAKGGSGFKQMTSDINASSSALKVLQSQLDKVNASRVKLATASKGSPLAQSSQQAAKSAQTAADSMDRAAKSAVNYALKLAAAAVSVQKLVAASDGYTTMRNKLQNVADSQAQVDELTERMFKSANDTRSSVEDTTTAFARFDRALKMIGKSQEDSISLTETVNKALQTGGATASEASSALLQLSQAFNAGKLQGDEFRSLAENMPIVLDAIAKEMGQPVSALKKLGAEGKITTEILYEAFKGIKEQVDDKFSKTTMTIEQSLTILSNNFTKFVGELNRSTGIFNMIADSLLFLANNMDTLVVASVALGSALAVTFSAQIIASIQKAASAVKAFTVALAGNPLGLLLVALATVITYFVMFKDEINLGIDSVTTLGDFFTVVFQDIKSLVEDAALVWDYFFGQSKESMTKTNKIVEASAESWTDAYGEFFTTSRTGWAAFIQLSARTLDALAMMIRATINFTIAAVPKIITAIADAVVKGFNFMIEGVEKTVNLVIEAINAVSSVKVEPINFEKLNQVGTDEFESFGTLWARALEDGFDAQGGALEKKVEGWFTRSQELSAARSKSKPTGLRGEGESTIGSVIDSKVAKQIERRALAMAKINAELDNELDRMFLLQTEREAQARFDQIEESLITKKIKLTDDEALSIKGKILAIQEASEIQKQYDALYTEANGPLLTYNASQEALSRLLKSGAISQEQHARMLTKATDTYQRAVDPMRDFNKQLAEENKLLKMLPGQREVEQRVMQEINELRQHGIELTEESNKVEIEAIRQKYVELKKLSDVSEQVNTIMDDGAIRRQREIDQLKAINQLLADKASKTTKADALMAISKGPSGAYISETPEMMNAQISRLGEYYAIVAQMRKDNLISEQSAMAANLKIWNEQNNVRLNSAKTFFGALELLQRSSNRRIAAIGKAAAVANTIVSTYQSATAAYASMAGIPYVGPALGAAAAAAAIAAGMMNVAQIRSQNTSFDSGGYTGDIPTNQVAGVVHGGEFVFDAQSTARIGRANLQALQSGASNVNRNTPQPMSSASKTDSKSPTVITMRNINVLDPALVGEYLTSQEGEQVFVNTMRRNSDQIRQIIQNA